MAGGKSNWNDDPIKKNGVICGRKTFDISDRSERQLCANELLCRQFLKDKKSTFITNLVVIEPETVQTLLDEVDSDKVRCDFWGERDRFEKALSSVSGKVTLFIELGTSDTKALFKDYAMDYSHHETEILSIIRRLFEMVNVMRKIGFVNTDIKADNLIYSERDNEPSLIMNDFDTSFILNTDKGIRFKSIDKHPFTEPAPELVGWHTENRVGNWTDIFIAGILAYRLLNNFDYPEAFVNAKTGISDITERYFEYQRLFNSLAEGEAVIEPPANGSDELKRMILGALQLTPEKRPDAGDVLEAINLTADKTRDYSGSSACNSADDENSEIIQISRVKKKSAFSYMLYALPFIAFIGILSFVMINQFRNGTGTRNTYEPSTASSGHAVVTDTSQEASSSEYSGTVSAEILTEATVTANDAVRETEKATTMVTKSAAVKETERETSPDEPTEQRVASSEERTEAPDEPVTEAESPFTYRETEIDGMGIFADTSGIEITGYSDEEKIPSCLELPDTIDGQKVVSIADDAFCGCDIEEVVIPDSVVYIGEMAFCNCPSLWRITLGKKVSMIGEQAFFNTQYSGSHDEREIIIRNPGHMNCAKFFGDMWDGREHDYVLVYNN